MARAAKKVTESIKESSPDVVNVRLEIVKLTVPLEGFMELELPVQLSIIDTLTKYVLTGER